jgi:hypothetical protein
MNFSDALFVIQRVPMIVAPGAAVIFSLMYFNHRPSLVKNKTLFSNCNYHAEIWL